jgi:MoxR-like ATPase
MSYPEPFPMAKGTAPATLPEPVRRALKARLRAIGALKPGDATPKATLLALAEQHGIDIASLPVTPLSTGTAALAEDLDDDTMDALDALDAEDEAKSAGNAADIVRIETGPFTGTPIDQGGKGLAAAMATPDHRFDSPTAILAKLGTGDWPGATAMLDKLYEAACKPVTVEKIVTVEKVKVVEKVIDRVVNPITHKGHCPVVVDTDPANILLGTAEAGRISLPVYDAPDAPAIDLDYVWPAGTGMALAQLARGRNVFLSGPRGVGKTSWAEQLAARQHRPFVRVQCHEQTDAATLVGMTVPDGKGGTRWQDGILSAAIRRPGTLVLIDEPSIARPGALFAFQSVLDGSRALVSEETGERIPCAAGVQFILADNTRGHGDEAGLYAGTRAINSATLDRCGILLLFGWLPPDKEAAAIAARAKCPLPLAEALVAFAKLTRDTAEAGRLTAGLGPRRLIAWAECVCDGYANEAAFDATIHDVAAQEDRETLRQLFRANISITTLKQLAKA